MKIALSVDIEGASCVVNDRETGCRQNMNGDMLMTDSYIDAKNWLTGDVNAAVEGALEAGATEFTAHDSHGGSLNLNLLPNNLHPEVRLIRGEPIVFWDIDDLKSGGYDACFLIAMHAMADKPSVLSHELDWPLITCMRINGEPVGESEITIALAGYYEIPAVLITGDDIVCKEISNWLDGKIKTAIIKKSLSRYTVDCLSPKKSHEIIKKAAFSAVKSITNTPVRKYEGEIKFEIDLIDRQLAKYVSYMPKICWDGAHTVSYTSKDFLDIYKAMFAMFWVAHF